MKKYFFSIVLSSSLVNFCFSQTHPKSAERSSVIDSLIQRPVAIGRQQASNWSLLSLSACKVDEFLKAYPTSDGRGTIVMILDDGVDPGIAGLLQTSEGKKKIIDVQDFAGTGDLFWQDAERDGDKLISDGKTVLTGLNGISINAFDGKYYYASLPEKRFQNGLGDLNFNGRRDDNFGVLIYQDRKNHWSAVIDADADSSLANESILSNYKEHQDVFHFRASKTAAENDGRFLTGAVNIFPDEHRINLYFADGGHGTHVAGIAGGYKIDNQEGFNGVAPGAEMIALKFADNTMDGVTVSGSMKRAYEYVIKTAQESGKPVIVNMSFGIGSEIEGQSVMDEWLDSLLAAHPEVTVCISAGNDGPGLSNVGLPGSARTVITSGAALPAETARDLYGLKTVSSIIWDFSSRGGELAKPDIVSPGTAISTVPDYVFSDRYNGTSMSSPYTTGCCAILISGMKQMFPDYVPNANDIKRALELGAVPFPNAILLDEGGGMINVPKAFEYLVAWQKKKYHPREYEISVPIPSSVKKGTAAFYRNGIYPKNGERTVFTISPLENKNPKTRAEVLSFNAFDLRSNASWLEPVQSIAYKRGEGPFQVLVNYDPKQLQKPGVYCGKISAYARGSKSNVPEFELWNTVLIPHHLTPENSFATEIKDIKVKSGVVQREFFTIPAGVKVVKISLASRDITSDADAVIINNDGRTFSFLRLKPSEEDESASRVITGEDLEDGVWEIDIKRGLASDDEKEVSVDLKVEAIPMEIHEEYLSPEKGKFRITNASASDLAFESSRIDVAGYERFIDTTISESDTYLYQFKARPGEEAITFDCSLSREDYNLFTDIALQILKPDGTAAFNGGFDLRESRARISFLKNDTTTYLLKFRGGLADPEEPHKFTLRIRERREREKTNSAYCKLENAAKSLSPDQTEYLIVPPIPSTESLPSGYAYYGDISFRTEMGTVRLPITFSR